MCAAKGLDVLLMDRNKDLLQRGIVGTTHPAVTGLPHTVLHICPAVPQVCAAKGLDVLLMDRNKDLLERGIVGIKKSLKRLNEKGQVTKEAAEEAIGRIRTETTMDVSLLLVGQYMCCYAVLLTE